MLILSFVGVWGRVWGEKWLVDKPQSVLWAWNLGTLEDGIVKSMCAMLDPIERRAFLREIQSGMNLRRLTNVSDFAHG